MRKLTSVLTMCIVLMMMPFASQAQVEENPAEVDVALQTLSAALGVSITQDILDYVSWREVTFNTTALGCPLPQQTYQPLNTTGYQVYIVYQGITYDYRVTSGAEFVLLCSTTDATVTIPADSPFVEPIVIDVPADNTCPNALIPRLEIGEVVRTTPELGSNIRDMPDLNATDLGTIPPSTNVTVLDGPECGADGNYWWQVDYDGLIGWTIQGQDGLYYVEPIPQPLTATTQTINSTTATQIIPMSTIEGNLLGVAAWSPDGSMLAIADASTANPAIWLYLVGNLSQVPILVEVDFDTTALAFSPDGSLLAIGDPQGNVHLMELNTYTEVHSFIAHDTAVLDIDFDPTGNYMMVIDDNYTARFYGVVTP